MTTEFERGVAAAKLAIANKVRDMTNITEENMRIAEECLRSRPDFYENQIEQLAFELAFELEEASLDKNDLVAINRKKLEAIATRVLARQKDEREAAVKEAREKALEESEKIAAAIAGNFKDHTDQFRRGAG